MARFWAGFATAFAVFSLVQDLMGREAYAQHVLDHWVSPWFTVPLALLVFAISAVTVLLSKDEA